MPYISIVANLVDQFDINQIINNCQVKAIKINKLNNNYEIYALGKINCESKLFEDKTYIGNIWASKWLIKDNRPFLMEFYPYTKLNDINPITLYEAFKYPERYNTLGTKSYNISGIQPFSFSNMLLLTINGITGQSVNYVPTNISKEKTLVTHKKHKFTLFYKLFTKIKQL